MNRMRYATHRIGALLIDRDRYTIERRSRYAENVESLSSSPDFFFVQVGAHDGVRFDGLYQLVTRGYPQGLVIEPLPRYFARLRANYEDYPGVTAINAALHPTQDFITIHHPDPAKVLGKLAPPWATGIGSVDPAHYLRSAIPAHIMTRTRARATTFIKLLQEHCVTHVDVLQIDTEGFDLEILKMFPFSDYLPRLVKFEHDSLEASARAEAEKLLKAHEYTIYHEGEDTVGISSRGRKSLDLRCL